MYYLLFLLGIIMNIPYWPKPVHVLLMGVAIGMLVQCLVIEILIRRK